MDDWLNEVLTLARDPESESSLKEVLARETERIRASERRGDRSLVAQAEETVIRDPADFFEFDSTGYAVLNAAGNRWNAGRFETPSIGELRLLVERHRSSRPGGAVRLWVFDGRGPLTDIGTLQGTCGGNTLFQVASQFNCLESPGPHVTRVSNYFGDPTQGPRASISAFPATLLRHYRAPGHDGERFVQGTDSRQLDLLAGACGAGKTKSGYLTGEGISDSDSFAASLESNFDAIRVGVHDQAQVVFGHDWDGQVDDSETRIAQVFTSTVAGGSYGGERNLGLENFRAVCRQLLRAAYLGTLLSAFDLGRTRVVLTLIGGGVFQNPIDLIWDSIQWAILKCENLVSRDLEVIVNGFTFGSQIDLDRNVLPAVREREGAIIEFNQSGLAGIRR